MDPEKELFAKCTRLAATGLDFSHHIRSLTPEYTLRLKHFVLNLPEEIAKQTIYGRAVWKEKDILNYKKSQKN